MHDYSPSFPCEECSLIFTEKSNITRHLKTHSPAVQQTVKNLTNLYEIFKLTLLMSIRQIAQLVKNAKKEIVLFAGKHVAVLDIWIDT